MKLIELFEEISEEYLNNPSKIDQVYNPEAHKFAQRQRDWRDKQGTGIIKKPSKPDESEIYKTDPDKDSVTSPGYRGLQSVRKKAGHKYDKSVLKPKS